MNDVDQKTIEPDFEPEQNSIVPDLDSAAVLSYDDYRAMLRKDQYASASAKAISGFITPMEKGIKMQHVVRKKAQRASQKSFKKFMRRMMKHITACGDTSP
jgi:hypothetical protein